MLRPPAYPSSYQPSSARGRNASAGMRGRQQRLGPSGSTPRSQNLSQDRSQTGSDSVWLGSGFFIQIERCAGIGEQVVSVRFDEDKYIKHAEHVRNALLNHFEGQLNVEIVEVPTLYACEVRVMPSHLHPRLGEYCISDAARAAGAKTLHSKVLTKKWPKVESVIDEIKEFCKIPIRITLLSADIKEEDQNTKVPPHRNAPRNVNSAVNTSVTDGVASKPKVNEAPNPGPVRAATLFCEHRGSQISELHTDAAGQILTVLHPGKFRLICGEDSNCDRLFPSEIAIPARFSPLEITIMATMKKKCIFYVVDHLNKPFPNFPLCFVSKEPSPHLPVLVSTKANGKARCRLSLGKHVATYNAPEGLLPEAWLVATLRQEVEVQDQEASEIQYFQIRVRRLRFSVEVVLRTRFEDPVVLCDFAVRNGVGHVIERGSSSSNGLARCEVPAGTFQIKLEPGGHLPFLASSFEVHVNDDGTYSPAEWVVATKTVNATIHLITPDGLPAVGCAFTLSPKFGGDGRPTRGQEVALVSDEDGRAQTSLVLLEPYIFRVKTCKVAEYMPQEFVFMSDKHFFTTVVARSVFGLIPEERVVFLIDCSGSMAAYLGDVKAALNQALLEQFHGTTRLFDIMKYTGKTAAFRDRLVESSSACIEDAMRFTEYIEAGGQSAVVNGLAQAFRMTDIEAIYLVTDGKCELGEDVLNHIRTMHFSSAARPRVNTIGINLPPERLTYRHLNAIANSLHGCFRAVCLEKEPPPVLGQILSSSNRHPGLEEAAGLYPTTDEEAGSSCDSAGEPIAGEYR